MTAIAYIVIAVPLCLGSHISLRLPAVTARGADPKKPLKKRPMKTVCRSFAVAVRNAKQAERKKAGKIAIRRP
jgi:hypothetical protein